MAESKKGTQKQPVGRFSLCRIKTIIRSAFFLEERLKSKKKHLDETNGFKIGSQELEKHRSRAGLISSSKETT
jgi:hypothetical protein